MKGERKRKAASTFKPGIHHITRENTSRKTILKHLPVLYSFQQPNG